MVSDKYIQQLIEDISAAKREQSPPFYNDEKGSLFTSIDDTDLNSHFEEVENYLNFDAERSVTFGNTIGLSNSQFPPMELLSKKQMQSLYHHFDDLLLSYNITTDIPEKLSIKKKYSLIITILDESIFLTEMGMVGWEFCVYNIEECQFGGKHCYCLKIERECEQNIKDALQLLEDIKEGCEETLISEGKARLKISLCGDISFNMMCMFIASGSEYLPYSISFHPLELEAACLAISRLFEEEKELITLFDNPKDTYLLDNLSAFLSLNVEKYEDNIFYVEPYYIEEGVLKKGISPYTEVDELLRKIAANKNDIN